MPLIRRLKSRSCGKQIYAAAKLSRDGLSNLPHMHIFAIIRVANRIKVDDDCLANMPSLECSLGSLQSAVDCLIPESTRAHRLAHDSFARLFMSANTIEPNHAELAQLAPEGSVLELFENLEARTMCVNRCAPFLAEREDSGIYHSEWDVLFQPLLSALRALQLIGQGCKEAVVRPNSLRLPYAHVVVHHEKEAKPDKVGC
jgi:hypothetical protein